MQSIISCGGEARGVRLLSGEGVAAIFEEQSNGPDLVLGVPLRFGMGYGLASETMPMGPRSCSWGGYGGSLVVNDLDARVTIAYVMNRMEAGMLGDRRGASIAMATIQGPSAGGVGRRATSAGSLRSCGEDLAHAARTAATREVPAEVHLGGADLIAAEPQDLRVPAATAVRPA